MPSSARLTYKSPEKFEPFSEEEKKEASARISDLISAKKSCANCIHSHKPKSIRFCLLKDSKRISDYNICIHHKS